MLKKRNVYIEAWYHDESIIRDFILSGVCQKRNTELGWFENECIKKRFCRSFDFGY